MTSDWFVSSLLRPMKTPPIYAYAAEPKLVGQWIIQRWSINSRTIYRRGRRGVRGKEKGEEEPTNEQRRLDTIAFKSRRQPINVKSICQSMTVTSHICEFCRTALIM